MSTYGTWTPMNAGQPPSAGRYLVWVRWSSSAAIIRAKGEQPEMIEAHDIGLWIGDRWNFLHTVEVLAWMPLPPKHGQPAKPIRNSVKVKRGIYITLVPHGYEIDFLRHKDVLDLYMKDESFIIEAEARSFGDNVDVVKATDAIIDFVRGLEQTLAQHRPEHPAQGGA